MNHQLVTQNSRNHVFFFFCSFAICSFAVFVRLLLVRFIVWTIARLEQLPTSKKEQYFFVPSPPPWNVLHIHIADRQVTPPIKKERETFRARAKQYRRLVVPRKRVTSSNLMQFCILLQIRFECDYFLRTTLLLIDIARY
jgi:hypothetical protein